MPAPAVVLEQPTLTFWHVLGAGAQATLRAADLPVPEHDLDVRFHGHAFVMRAGAREYLVAGAQEPVPAPEARAWVLRRHDRLLALRGPAWRAAMSWVCHYDFGALEPGRWLQVAMAGVDVWATRPDADSLLFGCDPSCGAYVQNLLHQILRDHADSISTE